ncbi:MAG TPA: hypothetical protein VE033_17080 [Acetobacteraceae bacterium]|jgi:hypothetical protein|nr:hypothetical protein [Acetobacteraceae bacterium]
MRRKSLLRTTVAVLCAIGVAAPALAQTTPCVLPNERRAFEVRALQTQLQVAALQCRDEPGYARLEEEYRQFVRKFQSQFATEARDLIGYYRRTAGSSSTRVLDASITNLALEQSQEATRHGTFYCPLVAPMFRLANEQSTLDGLAQLAVERNVLNPTMAAICPERAAATPAARRSGPAARPAQPRR